MKSCRQFLTKQLADGPEATRHQIDAVPAKNGPGGTISRQTCLRKPMNRSFRILVAHFAEKCFVIVGEPLAQEKLTQNRQGYLIAVSYK